MTELWIVQPYVPSYRVPFFERLIARLGRDGVNVRVAAGSPRGAQARRGDSQSPNWLVRTEGSHLDVLHHTIGLGSSKRHWAKADGVIVPLMGSSRDALSATLRRGGPRVGLWGHVAPYTSPGNRIDLGIERWQMRRADRVFSYTPGGAAYAEAHGIDASKVTVVMNTIDTEQLAHALAQLGDGGELEFRRQHSISAGPLFAFVGGLDASKRVAVLAEVLDELNKRGVSVHVVVGGAGEDLSLLRPAETRGQLTILGYVNTQQKADLLNACDAVLSPGRVGLLAVDGLVAKKPILTTRWPFHAPEYEYLTEGSTAFASEDSVQAYADLVERFARAETSGATRDDLSWSYPDLDSMVDNFAGGVLSMLGDEGAG